MLLRSVYVCGKRWCDRKLRDHYHARREYTHQQKEQGQYKVFILCICRFVRVYYK